jgi:hypothetical protein
MRRTSFFGALAVIALGGVLAFALQSTPRSLDLHATGLILMLAGIADLVIRFVLGDSPLFSPETADVAAVVEPVGEPVLDVFGNPITTAQTPVHVLRPPAPGSIVPTPAVVVPEDDGLGGVLADDTRDLTVIDDGSLELIDPTPAPGPQVPVERAVAYEEPVLQGQPQAQAQPPQQPQAAVSQDQVVRRPGDYGPPESLKPVSLLTGRPVRGYRLRRRAR